MNTPPSAPTSVPRRVYLWLGIGWLLVIVKVVVTPALLQRWNVPIDAGWVILPTLVLAAVVTLLVLGHSWTRDDS